MGDIVGRTSNYRKKKDDAISRALRLETVGTRAKNKCVTGRMGNARMDVLHCDTWSAGQSIMPLA